ncbi:MAG TPA: ATP-dependent DNA helicase RecG, partial [Chroococcales cyanobacterium]
ISKIPFGEPVTVWGTIQKVEAFSPPSKPNLSIVSVTLSDDTGKITARWFYGKSNRYQLERYKARFPVGEAALLSGIARFDDFLKKPVMERPEFEFLGKAEDSLHVGRIVPIYSLTDGLSLKILRRAIHNALETYSDRLPDLLPGSWREELDLGTRAAAIREIHFPSSQENLEKAKNHLVFLEFFWFQLGLAYRRNQRNRESLAPRIASSGKLTNQFLQNLPFSLTGAQSRVFEEVLRDLKGTPPMNRLVQGDVGSGKTVVALLALLAAVEAGFQGALMAPTEILAEQHYRKFQEWLVPLGVHPALLLGKQTAKEREAQKRAIIAGDCQIAVGTHALIQESVAFKNLGLVVIDEQHRFGVRQRAKLRSKGLCPQLLSMTATPIPRTLSLVTHGDLDVSIIDELPPGRKNILTRWVKGKKEREEVWKMIEDEVARGFQAYVVFPLVEESEKLDVKAATQEKARLEAEVFPNRRVALLHGQMPPLEKEEVIEAFRRHEKDILVSTTVIEVGVDVPKATVMVIENAERFGLSQLHQLRGRVGRGGDQSYCFLATGKTSDEVKRRMEVMVSTNDGFLIAEEDLRLRGPGEFLGTRQSGMPEFRLADIVRDAPVLEEARRRA